MATSQQKIDFYIRRADEYGRAGLFGNPQNRKASEILEKKYDELLIKEVRKMIGGPYGK